jgi:hypothetical protein
LRGIEAGADEIENAAELQVVADDLREKLRVRFGGVNLRSEIGDGYARLFDAEASAGLKPGLRRSPAWHKQSTQQQNANGNAS